MLLRLKAALARPVVQLAVLLVFSLLYRVSTFGHPNLDSDEALYFLVGQYMHEGMIPYVDIWDRKPYGLFALYYLFAGISHSVLAYQIPAWLFAGATAWIIALIVKEMANARGGLLAGIVYIVSLPLFWGWGGQAPVFYNLPIAWAALLVLRASPRLLEGEIDRRVGIAMLLGGLAITLKQTALFEAAYFGLFATMMLARSSLSRARLAVAVARWMAIGALPTLAIMGYYALNGHWAEYWHAMVGSNLEKKFATTPTILSRTVNTYLWLGPLLITAVLAFALKRKVEPIPLNFVLVWLFAAAVGFLSVPNMYQHYSLPLIVPLAAASGLLFARKDIGLAFFAVLAGLTVFRFSFYDFGGTIRAQRSLAAMANAINSHGGERGLLIFDGPVPLYAMTHHRPMSPLALPFHLNYSIEEDVSHLSTAAEVYRMLAMQPGVVLKAETPRNNPKNETTTRMVDDYVKANCTLVDVRWSSERFRNDRIEIWGDCGKRTNHGPARH